MNNAPTLSSRVRTLVGAPKQMLFRLNYLFNRPKLSELNCRFVSSRGVALACHPLVEIGTNYIQRPKASKLANLATGTPIFVFTRNIPEFVATCLPQIREPFVLVTGADDFSVSRDVFRDGSIDAILENNRITKWFAQNAEIAHPKLNLLPIGIDYHTLAGHHNRPWRKFQSPLSQEREFLLVRSRAPQIADRLCTAYANWHFSLQRGDRRECYDKIDHDGVFFEPRFVPRRQSWSNNARHLFTISPLGNGLDCHRTWEALSLGTIPVVHSSPLDSLYEGLPVCVVQDWAQVTPSYLETQRKIMLGQTYDFSRLYLSYWRDRLNLGKVVDTDRLTIAEFLNLHN